MEKALQALTKFLSHVRNSKDLIATGDANAPFSADYSNVTDSATIVDTSLLKAYIKTNDPELSNFLKGKNFCHVKECDSVLQTYKKISELVLLYKSKGLHRNALELLAKYDFILLMETDKTKGMDRKEEFLDQLMLRIILNHLESRI